jgi:hypothetical protein
LLACVVDIGNVIELYVLIELLRKVSASLRVKVPQFLFPMPRPFA